MKISTTKTQDVGSQPAQNTSSRGKPKNFSSSFRTKSNETTKTLRPRQRPSPIPTKSASQDDQPNSKSQLKSNCINTTSVTKFWLPASKISALLKVCNFSPPAASDPRTCELETRKKYPFFLRQSFCLLHQAFFVPFLSLAASFPCLRTSLELQIELLEWMHQQVELHCYLQWLQLS